MFLYRQRKENVFFSYSYDLTRERRNAYLDVTCTNQTINLVKKYFLHEQEGKIIVINIRPGRHLFQIFVVFCIESICRFLNKIIFLGTLCIKHNVTVKRLPPPSLTYFSTPSNSTAKAFFSSTRQKLRSSQLSQNLCKNNQHKISNSCKNLKIILFRQFARQSSSTYCMYLHTTKCTRD